MGSGVVDVANPAIESFVELMESGSLEAWKVLGLNGLKEPFDFPSSLRLIGFGVDQGYAQRCRDFPKMGGAKGGAIVYIELSREPAF